MPKTFPETSLQPPFTFPFTNSNRTNNNNLEALSAIFKAQAADFCVEEILGWEPSGEGEHVFLYLEKTNLNTEFLAKQLAQHLKVPERQINYSGLKDRRALTRQWFGLHLPGCKIADWSQIIEQFSVELKRVDGEAELRLLKQTANQKKLQIW